MIIPTHAEAQSIRIFQNDGMSKTGLRQSGSHWSSEQIDALHVVRFENTPVQRFFPHHMPRNNDTAYLTLREAVVTPTFEDLRKGHKALRTQYKENLFREFFLHLSTAIATGQAEDEDDEIPDDASGITGSSHENQPEIHSELALKEFVRVILGKVGDSLNSTWTMEVSDERLSTRLWIGTNTKNEKLKKALCDGGIVLSKDSSAGSYKPGNVPIVSFEAKPRKLGTNTHYSTGEEEPYSPAIFGQEVAEMFGQASECTKGTQGQWAADHDGWLISIHGSRLRLSTAYFSNGYLAQVNSPVLRSEERLLVWRSRQFNLKYPNDRVQAMEAIFALIQLLKSGAVNNVRLANALRP